MSHESEETTPISAGWSQKNFVGGNQRLIPAPLLSEAAAYTV